MPPKRSSTKSTEKQTSKADINGHAPDKIEDVQHEGTSHSKKRKALKEDTTPIKAQRRSGRAESKPSQQQLLKFLLSSEAEDLTRPEDERADIESRGKIRTYSSAVMNPFEELMCAIILSRPISHRLGLRTIRTVLNDPYNFTSAKATKDAGSEKQHQALWDAHTQHKDKTAQQLGALAEVVLEKFSGEDDSHGQELRPALEAGDINETRQVLKSAIKGLGATGLDIFFRRVQWLWGDIFPYIDGRTVDSLRRCDLPYDPEKLVKAIDDDWTHLDKMHLPGEDEAQKKRRAFVLILERVTGADLEGKIETLISHAAKA